MKTKRGNIYIVRSNKVATGITKTLTDQNYNISDAARTLSVYGTLDHLGRGNWLYVKQTIKKHPTDAGYTKKVYVLTDLGRARLKTMKRLKKSGLPLWEYMTKEILKFRLNNF